MDRTAQLDSLRRQVRALERGADTPPPRVARLGARALDERLPGGGLAAAGLHEVLPARTEWDDGAALGFALALLGRLAGLHPGPVLWATRRPDIYPPALTAFGLTPERLLLARTGSDEDTLWALEEGLRCPDLAAVCGEATEIDATAARRLQLAAETVGRPCLLLQRRQTTPRRAAAANPALTRWRVESAPSTRGPDTARAMRNLVGNPAWRVELLRCRGGRPAAFELEWDHATGDFAVAAELRDPAPAALDRAG
jgi:protein ImuA